MSLRVESISKVQERNPQRRLYLLYHELRASQSQYSYVTETQLFERHLDLFSQLRKADSSKICPELTFDDGHISNYELAAPILQSREMAAQFFITVGWTGTKPGYMGWTELRALQQAGFSIGAHGWTHTLLTHCSDDELQVELGKARLTLEDKLGISITIMSLPGGRYNRRVLAACAQAGYTQIYTSAPKTESLPLGTMVGRMNILGNMQPEWLAKLFQPDSSVLDSLGRKYRMKEAAKSLLGDRIYEKLWALANRKEPEADGVEGGEE
ncbi:MAG: polysaccharide deacetylase family protein [Acidobacteriaceae bacterium]|nr:polysaccharide deacetylase family protein [Acidobacteriaceae bacterium]